MKFNELYEELLDDSKNVITESNMKKNVELAKAGKAHKLTDDDLLAVHGYFENLWDRDSDNDDTYQRIVSSLEKEIEKRGFTQESKKVDGAKSEWAKHLRPELKRKANKQARKSAKGKLRKVDELNERSDGTVYYVLDKITGNIIWGYADSVKSAKEEFGDFNPKIHKVVGRSEYVSANS